MVKKKAVFQNLMQQSTGMLKVCVESGKICEFLRIEAEEGDVFVIKKGEDDANR